MTPPAKQQTETATAPENRGVERFLDAGLTNQIQFLTARARSKGSSHANQMLTELKLKVRHYSALSLAASGMKPTQRELGEYLNLDPSQVVALVDDLEKRGAVRRDVDPRDRRSRIIVATDEGLKLHDEATKILQDSEDVTLGNLTSEEREQLRGLLMKIAF